MPGCQRQTPAQPLLAVLTHSEGAGCSSAPEALAAVPRQPAQEMHKSAAATAQTLHMVASTTMPQHATLRRRVKRPLSMQHRIENYGSIQTFRRRSRRSVACLRRAPITASATSEAPPAYQRPTIFNLCKFSTHILSLSCRSAVCFDVMSATLQCFHHTLSLESESAPVLC